MKRNFNLLELIVVVWLFITGAIGAVLASIGLYIIVGLLLSWPLMYLWNHCLVGLVTGITPIVSLWQAWGLSILCGILFKSRGKK